jgi:hypothetical protein
MGQLPKPLSPAELDALRKKASPAAQQQAPVTSAEVAYETGIKALGPVVARIEKLEQQMKNLEAALATAARNGAELKALLEAATAPKPAPAVSTSTGHKVLQG